ncbi:carboxylesterase family protein [Corynebacterium timonense]|uniref:Carboxylic ester hydrolase n=1 Tax=Corynebacterium timonense TaxID=441500 RepID=A0A1H1M0Q5_9CORY|nr:carboxylesterase family protein [Corynebacterium timonense]SDR80331.1 Carboxylesterase type B [Corynebacterium timonense]
MSRSSTRTVDVDCPAGTVRGVVHEDEGVRRFHSIAYSRIPAPFNDALAAEPSSLIDATTPRPDDTALSLTTPATARPGADLPVMVFIHGGRFEEGTHADPRTGAVGLCRRGVIQVQLGYRLRLAGLARFPDDAPSHFRAVHDCQLGLEWIQRNIEAFGGDPTNVTVVGQSAGAALTLWLSRRDHYRGEFRRVLSLSPAFPRMSYDARKPVLRSALGAPLTRSKLNALSRTAPARLERAYRRLRTFYFTDMALGPAPLEPAELAEVDIVVTSTREEMYATGAFADARGLGVVTLRGLGKRMGLPFARYRSYIGEARALSPANVSGRFFSDSLIRRWVDAVAEGAPGPLWQAELTSAYGPLRHSGELETLFTPGTRLNSWLVDYCGGARPGWPQYGPGRSVLRAEIDGPGCEVVEDPLGYVRRAFSAG